MTTRHLAGLALLLALAGAGCSKSESPTQPTPFAETVRMSPGNTVTVPGTTLTLTFEQLHHPLHPGLVDCVANVPCGPFGVSAWFYADTPGERRALTTLYLTEPKGADRLTWGRYSIRLVRFEPAYDAAGPLPETAYSAVFEVSPH